MNTARIIGLTGVAGSGKSSVRAWLAEQGFAHLDADLVARDLLAEPHVIEAVTGAFGPSVASGPGKPQGIDRAALAKVVFSDARALERLEQLLHPGVVEAARNWLDEHRGEPRVIEAIKLVESGMDEAVDEVWLVTCDHRERMRRLLVRGWSEAEAKRRLRSGRTLGEHLGDCDLVIDNSGDWSATRTQLEAALERFQQQP